MDHKMPKCFSFIIKYDFKLSRKKLLLLFVRYLKSRFSFGLLFTLLHSEKRFINLRKKNLFFWCSKIRRIEAKYFDMKTLFCHSLFLDPLSKQCHSDTCTIYFILAHTILIMLEFCSLYIGLVNDVS